MSFKRILRTQHRVIMRCIEPCQTSRKRTQFSKIPQKQIELFLNGWNFAVENLLEISH